MPDCFHISGKTRAAGVSLEQAEAAVREELERLQQEPVDEQNWKKWRINSNRRRYSAISIIWMSLPILLGFELLGRAEDMEKGGRALSRCYCRTICKR